MTGSRRSSVLRLNFGRVRTVQAQEAQEAIEENKNEKHEPTGGKCRESFPMNAIVTKTGLGLGLGLGLALWSVLG